MFVQLKSLLGLRFTVQKKKRFKRMIINKTLREYGYPVEIPDDPNISMI